MFDALTLFLLREYLLRENIYVVTSFNSVNLVLNMTHM